MELDRIDTEKGRLQEAHEELLEKYKESQVRCAMQQEQLNAMAKGERTRLEVEGELRESVFNDLTRCVEMLMDTTAHESIIAHQRAPVRPQLCL